MAKPPNLGLRLKRLFTGDAVTATAPLAVRLIRPFQRAEARRKQKKYCGTYVAVTGSVGKSTACYLAAELLAVSGRVALGHGENTERHILRRLRRLDAPVDFVVQEISGHTPGIIARVTKPIRIDAAIVTTVGLDHQTNFRRVEAVAAEKGTLVEAVRPGGLVCLNADDANVRAMASRTGESVLFYGRAADAHIRADHVSAEWPERLTFDLIIGDARHKVRTRFVGTLMLPSILAALALIHGLAQDMEAALFRLAELEPLAMRLSPYVGDDGHTYLLETYKASLWSTALLVDDLPNLGPTRRILVLGEMSDVGNDAGRKYRQVLRAAAATCDLVIGVGPAASAVHRLRQNETVPNVIAARDFAQLRELIAAQPPSLVVLKSNSTVALSEILPSGVGASAKVEARRTIG